MRLAVSDTGFDQLNEVAIDLQNNGIHYIELVPTKHKSFKQLTELDLINYKAQINSIGLAPISLLSLFYTLDIKDVSEVSDIINHFCYLNDMMVKLDCDLMVFGSPTMRKKIDGWEEYVKEILFRVDSVLSISGKQLIIEPVASTYGAEFFTTIDEIVTHLKRANYTNIFTMIDTHNLFLENQDPIEKFLEYSEHIKHIHVAEVGLGKLTNRKFHKQFAKILQDYPHVITHEIRDKKSFKESVKVFGDIYG
jgi:sugar phosphate isomerase/epimerase